MEHNFKYKLYGQQRERRAKGPRFELSVPVRFQWKRRDGIEHAGSGTTRDVSGNGVFINCDCVPPPGAEVELIVDMPPMDGSRKSAQLHGKGLAIRVEEQDGRPVGFGAEMTFDCGWKIEAPTWIQ